MHFPGAGVGGHCLPKDSWLLKWGVNSFGKFKVEPHVIQESRYINDFMPMHMVELVRDAFNEKRMAVKGSKICILGVTFLENSDDTRNTPTRPVYEKLVELGAEVVVHDVHVNEEEGIPVMGDLDGAMNGSDCVVVMTGHHEYRKLDREYFERLMRTKMVVDGRNVYDPERFREADFVFRGIGKGVSGSD